MPGPASTRRCGATSAPAGGRERGHGRSQASRGLGSGREEGVVFRAKRWHAKTGAGHFRGQGAKAVEEGVSCGRGGPGLSLICPLAWLSQQPCPNPLKWPGRGIWLSPGSARAPP